MKLSQIFSALSLILLISTVSLAQGVIIPRPCTRPDIRCAPPPQIPQRPLKVKSIRFETKITDQVAVTHVEQVFDNDTPYILEGIYFFPLPDKVSITEFAMWDGSNRQVGEIRTKEEARRIYDEIVRSRRDPGLLEYAGKNLFQASVFPIQPNSEKKIELTYSQVLESDAGMVSYRYPLGTGWQAGGIVGPPPRPIPFPHPRERRDFDRETERRPDGQAQVASIAAVIEIVSRVPLKNIYSPSHEIDLKRDGERKARLSFETRQLAAQQDFQLFYSFSEEEFGFSLLTHREPGKDGYFMALLSPRAQLNEKEVQAKEIIFVLDTSGSMSELGKMKEAKAALRYGVNTLSERDRFNIVSFAGEEHLMAERPVAGDEAGKKQALDFIDRMKPAGGTNINDALQAAFKQLAKSDRPQMVVLITDGQPTVGETKTSQILTNARQAKLEKTRLFTFGVGYDVNTNLLDGLANENRGTVGYIEPNENIEVKISNFFAKVSNPVLSDLKFDWGGAETELIYPRSMPDLFHGSQIVLLGRYRYAKADSKKFTVNLSGSVNGRDRRFTYENLLFPEKENGNDFLPHLWAMRRVGHLLDQIRANGESKELRDEIVDLGTRYGIVTPYTSYLVLEPGMRTQISGGGIRQNVNPVSETVTIHSDGEREQSAVPLAPAGRSAVQMSKKKEALSRADKVSAEDDAMTRLVRQAAGRTFYFRENAWIDSEYKAEAKLPVQELKFGSDEFFALIGKEPKLGECFALGKNVTVIWNGKVYRVRE